MSALGRSVGRVALDLCNQIAFHCLALPCLILRPRPGQGSRKRVNYIQLSQLSTRPDVGLDGARLFHCEARLCSDSKVCR